MLNLSCTTLQSILKKSGFNPDNRYFYSSKIMKILLAVRLEQQETLTDEQQSSLLYELFTKEHNDMRIVAEAQRMGARAIGPEEYVTYIRFLRAIQQELCTSKRTVDTRKRMEILASIAPYLTEENVSRWLAHLLKLQFKLITWFQDTISFLQNPLILKNEKNEYDYLADEPNRKRSIYRPVKSVRSILNGINASISVLL